MSTKILRNTFKFSINRTLVNSKILSFIIYSFDSNKSQMRVSYSGKGCENHAFEKILKSLLIACSLPKNNPDT